MMMDCLVRASVRWETGDGRRRLSRLGGSSLTRLLRVRGAVKETATAVICVGEIENEKREEKEQMRKPRNRSSLKNDLEQMR